LRIIPEDKRYRNKETEKYTKTAKEVLKEKVQ
jgi:hypothetical protein